jgi:hypothetical protein
MQYHALIALRHLEGSRRLVGRPALGVAQGDDEPLCRREPLDRFADDVPV